MFNFFRNIKYGLENLIMWFPVIWKDRNWDHTFIYEILKHKLDLTQKHLRKYGHHVDAEKDADRIKVCVNLLNRLIKDDYHENAFKKHHEKWGEPEFNWTDLQGSELSQLQINYKNVKTDQDKANQEKEYRKCIEREEFLKNQDLDLLFKIMRKHIQGWWD